MAEIYIFYSVFCFNDDSIYIYIYIYIYMHLYVIIEKLIKTFANVLHGARVAEYIMLFTHLNH